MPVPVKSMMYDMQPGGGLVTAMGGYNALSDAMLKTQQQQLENYYLPYTKQAEVAQKMAQAQYLGPQILTQFLSNPNIWATLDPSVQAALSKQLSGYFTNPQSAMPYMPPLPQQGSGNSLGQLFRGGPQGYQGGGMPGGGMPNGGAQYPGNAMQGSGQPAYQGAPSGPPIQAQDTGGQPTSGSDMIPLPALPGTAATASGNAVSSQAILDKANGVKGKRAQANAITAPPAKGSINTPAARQVQQLTANIPGGANPQTGSTAEAENVKENLLEQTKSENQNWDAVHAEAAHQAEMAPQLNQLNEDMIEKYRKAHLKNYLGDIPVKGLKTAPLRAFLDTSNEQGVDQDRAQMIQMLGKNVQPTGHITDSNYSLLSQSKFDRSFTPAQAESAYEKNKALITRSAEKQPFLQALQNNNPNASWKEGQILFNLYATQKPAFAHNKFQEKNVGPKAWKDYVTPEALDYVRSNRDFLPKSATNTVEPATQAPQPGKSHVRMIAPDGRSFDIPANNVPLAIKRGLKKAA